MWDSVKGMMKKSAWGRPSRNVDRQHRPPENISRRPYWVFQVVDVNQTEVFMGSTEVSKVFSTGRFSSGRRQPDWGFQVVDVDLI